MLCAHNYKPDHGWQIALIMVTGLFALQNMNTTPYTFLSFSIARNKSEIEIYARVLCFTFVCLLPFNDILP